MDKAPCQPSNVSTLDGLTGDMMERRLDCAVETSSFPMAWPVAFTNPRKDPGDEGPSIPVGMWQPTQLMEMCASERDQRGACRL